MKINRSNFLYTVILATIVFMSFSFSTISSAQKTKPENKGFVKLFNGENWDGWHLKLKNGDEELAKKVYAIEDGMVHVFNDDFPNEYVSAF